MAKADLTAERLREVLDYSPETGEFRWKQATGRRRSAGDSAGYVAPHGYVLIGVDGKMRHAHRLAWQHVHGVAPQNQIDHINGNRADNRIANLRSVTAGVNQQNRRGANCRNGSGYLGVSWHAKAGKWQASIYSGGRNKGLGLFVDAADAHQAYLEAKRKLHEGCTI